MVQEFEPDLLRVVVSRPRAGVLVVSPVGQVDINAATLRDAMMRAIEASPRCVVVDLDGLTFCGAAALHVLEECRKAAQNAGVGFGTVGGRPIVRRVLEVTHLGPFLGHGDVLDDVVVAAERDSSGEQ